MPERLLALCQFDISFEGFWNLAINFHHQAAKSCVFFFWVPDGPVPKGWHSAFVRGELCQAIFQRPPAVTGK